MPRKDKRIKAATQASSEGLLDCLNEQTGLPSFKFANKNELTSTERSAIWGLFETNMFDLYSNSSFGWKPAKRKREIFHNLSRFLIVYESEQQKEVIAFCMFRFEKEEGEVIVYCYDIQVSSRHQGAGIGRKMMSVLETVGGAYAMEKMFLTVLKANSRARLFYESCGYEVDPSSPSVYVEGDDPELQKCDYKIMSKIL